MAEEEVVATEGVAEVEDEEELKIHLKIKVKMNLTPEAKDMSQTLPGTVAKLTGCLLKTLGSASRQRPAP